MKEFLFIVLFAFIVAFGFTGTLYYFIDIRPCTIYGQMVNLESKRAGDSCYVKREGVWIEKFYNDILEREALYK